MIVVQLQGGLGNQMFQYAFGKALSMRYGEELQLDISFLEKKATQYTQRNFELNVFSVLDKIANTNLIRSFEDAESSHPLYRIKRKFIQPRYHTSREKVFSYHPIELPDVSFKRFIGFWQSEKYFLPIQNEIRNIFSFSFDESKLNLEVLQKMKQYDSISIHIRRGDYVTNSAASAFHGTCDLDYYKNGILEISRDLLSPAVFVFSDDPEWVQKNINFSIPTFYVNHNQGKESYLDIGLMSKCAHHIIANSSFSWWGAWLNTFPAKKVIAPKKWFSDSGIDTSDLIPNSWLLR